MSVESIGAYIPHRGQTLDQPLPGSERRPPTRPLEYFQKIADMIEPLIQREGIYASDKTGRFNRIFIRDGFTVADDRIESHKIRRNGFLSGNFVPAIFSMLSLSPQNDIPDAGIYRGQAGHEFGTGGFPNNWYKNENGVGINTDARDTNELVAIVADKLVDEKPELLVHILPFIIPMLEYSKRDVEEHNGLPVYTSAEFDKKRKYPGIRNQRWIDSEFSITNLDGTIPKHPIAALEIAAMAWSARHRWADRLERHNIRLELVHDLREQAYVLEDMFNKLFVYSDSKGVYLADALDGDLNQIKSVTCNPALVLAADYKGRSIIKDDEVIDGVTKRMFDELYDPKAGLRTVSKDSFSHPSNDYHGQNEFWIMPAGRAVRGLRREAIRLQDRYPQKSKKYMGDAVLLAESILRATGNFGTPVELFRLSGDGKYQPYTEPDKNGIQQKAGCDIQAWSASSQEYAIEVLRENGIKEVSLAA